MQQSLPRFDHRRLGRELELFTFDATIGKGLPIWLPRGTVVREELERLAKELEFKAGFERVATPHIARAALYRRSGHLPFYADDMYPAMEVLEEADDGADGTVKDEYRLRPMNCPHHHRVFAALPRSFRDLPLRLAEYGQVYRWERSGTLTGLARVRGMCMNDGHIYCTPDQVEDEVAAVLDLYEQIYGLLGIVDYRLRLSRRDPADLRQKYVEDAAAWDDAETLLARVLARRGAKFADGIGHAAFYGPKIDVQVRAANGVEETLSTVQVDFAQPGRLGLRYVAAGGALETPVCIHRAPFSTHERLVAHLLEIHGGALPLWLSPTQVVVVPVSAVTADYAAAIVARLRAKLVRAELADTSATVAKNVRDAAARKVPVTLVVGERERADNSVAVRTRGRGKPWSAAFSGFEESIVAALARRARALDTD